MNPTRWRRLGAAGRWVLLPALVVVTLFLFPPWAGRITGGSANTTNDVDRTNAPLVFYSFVPSGKSSASSWLAPMIRTLDAAGMVRADDQPVADGVLAASILASYPHRAAILDFQAGRVGKGTLDLKRLDVVIEIDAPGAFESIRRSLETALAHYSAAADVQQTEIELPGQRRGVRYRDQNWPAWVTLEWCTDQQHVWFGIGEGVLERWLNMNDPVRSDPSAVLHRAAANFPADADHFFEFFMDIRGLRKAAPTLFHTGRTLPLLAVFDMDRADEWMAHGWTSGTFLMLDTTTKEKGRLSARRLTQNTWPSDLGVPQPPGKFHLVAPIDWPSASERVTELVRWSHDPRDRHLVDESMQDFTAASGIQPGEAVNKVQPWLLVSDYPHSWLSLPGTVTLYAPLRPDVDSDEARAMLKRLMRPLREMHTAPDSVGVAYDRDDDIYWLDSPLRGLFKAPAWGWAESSTPNGQATVLVGSYSPRAIEENRRLLRAP